MIYITGDTHGRFEKFMRKTLILTENDSVIICGDFGGVWDGLETERRVISWLAKLPCTILFVDGNHENYDMLNALPTEEWHGGKIHRIAPNVIHLMQSKIDIAHKCKIAPLRAKKILDYKRGIYDIHFFSIYHNSISLNFCYDRCFNIVNIVFLEHYVLEK